MLGIGRGLEESSTAVLKHEFRDLDLLGTPTGVSIAVDALVQAYRVFFDIQTYRMFAGGSIEGMYSRTA